MAKESGELRVLPSSEQQTVTTDLDKRLASINRFAQLWKTWPWRKWPIAAAVVMGVTAWLVATYGPPILGMLDHKAVATSGPDNDRGGLIDVSGARVRAIDSPMKTGGGGFNGKDGNLELQTSPINTEKK